MRSLVRVALGALALMTALGGCGEPDPDRGPLRVQLNWFHDPTFAGEYRAADALSSRVTVLEGGVNVPPVQRLKSGLADVAIVGIDIALKAIEADISAKGTTPIRIVFVDLQRNPVGWIVHPRVVQKLGLNDPAALSGRERNDWLFEKFTDGSLRVGDKRGTETTAVWARWRQLRKLKGVEVTPVSFDPTVILSAPDLAYPVYLNEEPYKLAVQIGEPVVEFDPADDGVALMGNVLITTDEVLSQRKAELLEFLAALQEAWAWVRENPGGATSIVKRYYTDVPDEVVRAQIARTTEFVFFGVEQAGPLDVSDGGRLGETIDALKDADALSSNALDLQSVRELVVGPARN